MPLELNSGSVSNFLVFGKDVEMELNELKLHSDKIVKRCLASEVQGRRLFRTQGRHTPESSMGAVGLISLSIYVLISGFFQHGGLYMSLAVDPRDLREKVLPPNAANL